jgi:prolyl-tRNA editing enzyme YbaK/EbsC (Cys-tRNA(Pro) deacylase)
LGRARDLRAIGFDIGGVPAIGSGLKTVVDKRILERSFIIGSAGSPYVGIRMRPLCLVKTNRAIVGNIELAP